MGWIEISIPFLFPYSYIVFFETLIAKFRSLLYSISVYIVSKWMLLFDLFSAHAVTYHVVLQIPLYAYYRALHGFLHCVSLSIYSMLPFVHADIDYNVFISISLYI